MWSLMPRFLMDNLPRFGVLVKLDFCSRRFYLMANLCILFVQDPYSYRLT